MQMPTFETRDPQPYVGKRVVMAMSEFEARVPVLMREVASLRQQVEAIARHVGLGQIEAAEDGPSPAIVEAIQSGNKILAIKLQREATGESLASAKQSVFAIARDLGY